MTLPLRWISIRSVHFDFPIQLKSKNDRTWYTPSTNIPSNRNTTDKSISKPSQAILKSLRVRCTPVSAICSRNCLTAGEGNVQNIIRIVAIVSIYIVGAKAECGQADGSFTNERRTVYTIRD
jgi:hypothetical protein